MAPLGIGSYNISTAPLRREKPCMQQFMKHHAKVRRKNKSYFSDVDNLKSIQELATKIAR